MAKKTPRQRIYLALDKLWSLIIRSKRQCELCGKCGDISAFDPHHIKGRGHSTTRWWLGNGACLCKGSCHRWGVHTDTLKASLLIDKLKVRRGKEWHDELVERSKHIKKYKMSELRELKETLTKEYDKVK